MPYFLWIDEKQQGPYEKQQILDMLLTGSITKQTLCCPEGASDWNPVATIHGLFDELSPPRAGTLEPLTKDCFYCGESITADAKWCKHCGHFATQKGAAGPNPQDHCFIVCHGEHRGPYLPAQIRTMWQNGSITADSALVWGDITDPVPIAKLLSEPVFAQSGTSGGTGGAEALTFLGFLMFLGGIIGLIYYWQFFDTSVPTETVFGETFGNGRVHNIGLMQKQQNGIIISSIAAALGFVCILLGRNAGEKQHTL